MICADANAEEVVLANNTHNSSTTSQELHMFFEEQDLTTATKHSATVREVPAIATVISAEEIGNMGARSLLDVIRMVPGFGISRNEFGLYMIEMRGVRSSLSEKILVMLDGHPLNKNYTDSALYAVADMLPVENIKQVEVVRGPGSALYGNSAFLGTINIITRDAEEIDGVELKTGGGSFNTYKGGIVAGKAFAENFSASGSINYFTTAGQKLTVAADSLTGTPFSKAPGPADLGFRQLDAFLKATYGGLTFRGHYLTKKIGSYVGYSYALTNDSYDDIDTYWGELVYNHDVSDSLSFSTKAHFGRYNQEAQLKLFPNGFAGSFPDGVIGKPLLKNMSYGVEQQIDWEPFAGNHAIIGASYEELRQFDVKELVNFNPQTLAYIGPLQEIPGFNWNREVTRNIWAAYLQDEWKILNNVSITAGVRYDHYNDFGESINPRAGIVWSFLDNADLKLLYGRAFRAPNFIELYSANNPKFIGNPNLKPEHISTYEAGVVYRYNRYLAVDATYFYSLITDQIIWDATTTPARNANIGETVTQGIEVGLNGIISDTARWKATYTYQDPRDRLTGKRLSDVPSHRAAASINYAPFSYLNIYTDVLWTGARPRPANDTRAEMPSYATVNAAVTLRNFYRSLEIQLSLHNLLDNRYKDPDTSGAQQLVPGDFPREGFSALLTGSYRF
jgi:iron complex outermembrane receptor protein